MSRGNATQRRWSRRGWSGGARQGVRLKNWGGGVPTGQQRYAKAVSSQRRRLKRCARLDKKRCRGLWVAEAAASRSPGHRGSRKRLGTCEGQEEGTGGGMAGSLSNKQPQEM
jgi:hypothetical protein